MELEADGGLTRIPIGPGPEKTEIGRSQTGLTTPDRTVSRRHVSLRIAAPSAGNLPGEVGRDAAGRVSFEVVGKNPVLVVTHGGQKGIFRNSEVGELGTGDRISLSLKNPFFFSLGRCGSGGGGGVDGGVLDAVQRREKRTTQRKKEREEAQKREAEMANVSSLKRLEEGGDAGPDLRFQMPDLSQIDPVKEFGFLVRGHEFDHYRRKIRDARDWNWFLHEQRDGSDEDEEATASQKKGSRRRKQTGGQGNGDEDWTGESEDEKAAAATAAGAKRAKYLTRSKDQKKQKPASTGVGTDQGKGSKRGFEEEDEEDETLGGFIVDNEEEEEVERGEEEEEEFDEDEDDDD